MKNIENVVRERNQAYHLLETGVNGERPARMERDTLGMKFLYQYEMISSNLNEYIFRKYSVITV